MYSYNHYSELLPIFEAIPLRDYHDDRIEDFSSIPFPLLGTGTTRLVFDIGNGLVMKVADTRYGYTQNYNEFMLYLLYPNLRPILCPVVWANEITEESCRFLVMKHGFQLPFENLEYEEEIYIEALKQFGLCEREFELPCNWGNGKIIDYGSTLDSNPIDFTEALERVKILLENEKKSS